MINLFKTSFILSFLSFLIMGTSLGQGWVIEDMSTPSGFANLRYLRLDGIELANSATIGVFYDEGDDSKCIGFKEWDSTELVFTIQIYLPNSSNYNHNNRYFRVYDTNNDCELDIGLIDSFDPNQQSGAFPVDTARYVYAETIHTQKTEVTYQEELFCSGATVMMQSSVPPRIPIIYTSSEIDVTLDGIINLGDISAGIYNINTSSSFCLRAESVQLDIPPSEQIINSEDVITNVVPQRCNELGEVSLDWSSVSNFTINPTYALNETQNLNSGNHKFTAKTDQNCFYSTEVNIPLEACEELSFYPGIDHTFHVEVEQSVTIFNAVGKKVFTSDESFDWDGKDTQGVSVPTGQYFIVNVDEKPIPVTIIR